MVNMNKIWISLDNVAKISYATILTPLLIIMAIYLAKDNLAHAINVPNIHLPILYILLIGVAWLSLQIAGIYSLNLKIQDYKISSQFQTICFTFLFVILLLMLNLSNAGELNRIAPYIYFTLATLPAFYFYSHHALKNISTGDLVFGIFTLCLLSAFIPLSARFLIEQFIPLLTPYFHSSISQQQIDHWLQKSSIALPLILLYMVSPIYIKEYPLHAQNRERFAHFARLVQFLLIPIYLSLFTILNNYMPDVFWSPLMDIRLLLFLILPLMLISIISVIWRSRMWLADSNLLARELISPFILVSLLFYLKAPHLFSSHLDPTIYYPISFPFISIFANNLQMFGDIIAQIGFLDYFPAILQQFLFINSVLNPDTLLFIAIITHILLLIFNFWVLSRFIPHLFVFTILLIIPIDFSELLVLMGYAGLLFDTKLRKKYPTQWSIIWFLGGLIFLFLSPLYATFFLLGTLPFVICSFWNILQDHYYRARNLILIYSFLVIIMVLSPSFLPILTAIKAILIRNWLFIPDFYLWRDHLTVPFAQTFFYMLFPIWLTCSIIPLLLLLYYRKYLQNLTEAASHLGDWVTLSCGLTFIFSLPVIISAFLGFSESEYESTIRLFYTFFIFTMPMVLFRRKVPLGKFFPHIGCGLGLLLISFLSDLPIPFFEKLFTHLHFTTPIF